MRRPAHLLAGWAVMGLLAIFHPAVADVSLPANMTQPQTAVEAWNVIHLASANLDKLVAEPRLAEVSVQASLCNPALRLLVSQVTTPERRPQAAQAAQRASLALTSLVQACNVGNVEQARRQLQKFHAARDELKPLFDENTAAGVVYFCAMHPEFISEDAYTPCTKCGMRLFPRRIPHSFVFVAPGEPTTQMEVTAGQKLVAGQRAEVKIKLVRRDGVPVMHRDLMVMHTQPIHLLIVDSALQDYHHEHPLPGAFSQVPEGYEPLRSDMCGPAPRGNGEYLFSFTPRATGTYRVFADLVPLATGIQEYARTELAGAATSGGVLDKSQKLEATEGDMTFKLSFVGQHGAGLRARQTQALQIAVSGKDGRPMTQLEPFMNAFAHLVGFHEDGVTVVHLHPEGGDVLRNDVRGGPFLNFRFHPPKAGFLRLFCQVQREGKDIMVPFGVTVGE